MKSKKILIPILSLIVFVQCVNMAFSKADKKQGSQRPLKAVPAADVEKITQAMPDKPTVAPKKKRKVLIFYRAEGFYHGSIPWGVKCFQIMGDKTGAFESDISNEMDVFTPDNLSQYDGIVFENTTHLKFEDQAKRKALMDFVKGGKGVIVIHAGSDNFQTFPEAASMVGGVFGGHPWHASGTWAVKLDEPDHPLNKAFGGEGFKIKDEIYQYKGLPYTRDNNRVLLSLDLSDEATGKAGEKGARKDKDYAITWIKKCGEGRVFMCSLGHNKEVYWNKAVLQHYLYGVQYALGDYKVDDTPSNKK